MKKNDSKNSSPDNSQEIEGWSSSRPTKPLPPFPTRTAEDTLFKLCYDGESPFWREVKMKNKKAANEVKEKCKYLNIERDDDKVILNFNKK